MKPALLTLIALASAQANITLPAVISDRMVIQQTAPVRIWGHADPGESITVSLQN
jgi:sialate O-acetylesterase